MSTPESLVKAFAQGMIEALLATNEKPKKEKPIVAKTEDINQAVRTYLDQLAQQEEPQQQELFPQRDIDLGEAIYDRVAEARARAEAMDNPEDEPPAGAYRPDHPEETRTWQSPIR